MHHLIHPRLLSGFGMLVFFSESSLREFQFGYLALFCLFSVIDGFCLIWMGSLSKSIQLLPEISKALFLVLHFSYYISMTFLMKLSVILLSILMILRTKSHQASDLWQQLELASELESDLRDTVNWDRMWLLNFIAGKIQLV